MNINENAVSVIGLEVPDFCAASTGEPFSLLAHRGHPIVIYFYPKDSTPGCTTEAMQFRDLHEKFTARGAKIFGVSRDSVKSHQKFKTNLGLPFDLLADTDETVCRLFNVIKLKNMYGKELLGIERSTFLIDSTGKLRQEWRKIKADGHAEEVLAALLTL